MRRINRKRKKISNKTIVIVFFVLFTTFSGVYALMSAQLTLNR